MKKLVAVLIIVLLCASALLIFPVKADDKNIAPLPQGWDETLTHQRGLNDNTYASYYGDACTYPVSFGGYSDVLKLLHYSPDYTLYNSAADREINSAWTSIPTGSTLVFSAWVWTEASTIGDTHSDQMGATLGIDLYGPEGRICEVENKNGVGVALTHNGIYDDYGRDTVQWGSGRWVQLSMTFTMPSQVPMDHSPERWEPYGMYDVGAFIPWICGNSESPGNEQAAIYIRDIQLYIDPSNTPLETLTPTPIDSSPTPFPTWGGVTIPTDSPTTVPSVGVSVQGGVSFNLPLIVVIAVIFTMVAVGVVSQGSRRKY